MFTSKSCIIFSFWVQSLIPCALLNQRDVTSDKAVDQGRNFYFIFLFSFLSGAIGVGLGAAVYGTGQLLQLYVAVIMTVFLMFPEYELSKLIA